MRRLRTALLAQRLFGAPLVPSGRATAALQRLRARLLGLNRRLVPAPVRILEALLGIADNRVLGLLVELDIPDHLRKPRTSAELARLTHTDPDALARLLRFAASRGYVGHRRGRYRSNGMTKALRTDGAVSWRGWAEFASSPWYWDAWRHLDRAVAGLDDSGLRAATGHGFFEYVHTVDPPAGRVFDEAMAAGGRLHGLALAAALDWKGVRSVCDVGGGLGATLDSLLRVEKGLQGTVYDLPQVVRRVTPTDRLSAEGGSFFDRVPSGHDRYVLIAVIHDWDDRQATTILDHVRAAMAPDARAIVVENVLPDEPVDAFAQVTDLQMLAVSPGRERTRAEYGRLFTGAGLRVDRETLLVSGATAFVLAP